MHLPNYTAKIGNDLLSSLADSWRYPRYAWTILIGEGNFI